MELINKPDITHEMYHELDFPSFIRACMDLQISPIPVSGIALPHLFAARPAMIDHWPAGTVGISSIILGFETLESAIGVIRMKNGGVQ